MHADEVACAADGRGQLAPSLGRAGMEGAAAAGPRAAPTDVGADHPHAGRQESLSPAAGSGGAAATFVWLIKRPIASYIERIAA